MENEENKQSNLDQKKGTMEDFATELETLKTRIKKGKSDTTTLKILFYTGLAVLLLGFIYTNQTLQRAQYHNIESHISFLQGQVNHTLLLLETKLHREIQDLEAQLNGASAPNFHQTIQRMNQALGQLEPKTTSMDMLIEKVQKSSNELSQMISDIQPQEDVTPAP